MATDHHSEDLDASTSSEDDARSESNTFSDQTDRPRLWQEMRTAEDWWAIWCALFLLAVCFAAVFLARPTPAMPTGTAAVEAEKESQAFTSPLDPYVAKPGGWESNPLDSVYRFGDEKASATDRLTGTVSVFVVIAVLFAIAMAIRGESASGFLKAFPLVFLLAVLAYLMAGQSIVKASNLGYALWALVLGLLISNTVGTPAWLRPAVLTEFYIKTGLVLLGAEVLMSRLLALGIPGVFVAWVVTPVVLISTYLLGQKLLKIPSRSLNMVISADMSVCGVSAAIATAAACKAKKEELTLAVGMSLGFTVVMMVVMPLIIQSLGMDEILGGAWIGGTIDSTGAVAVAGATLGDRALEVAATVKMIQNILIGVTAFGVAIYWTTVVEPRQSGVRPSAMEIWYRFPKFVLGFVGVSIIFSLLYATLSQGPVLIDAMISGSTKTFRGWFFCLAFVSIGLATNFRELTPYMKGGKPLYLYLCGQTLNLCLTLFMAWLMFKVVFADLIAEMLK